MDKRGEEKMDCLKYPLDGAYIIKKKRQIKKELLQSGKSFLKKRIAILGGSTTSNVKQMIELFLLDQNIQPEFYESEYNQFYQDAVFTNERLEAFAPDLIYIHTSNRNIAVYPLMTDSEEVIETKFTEEYNKFVNMWERLIQSYHCPIIQNNFEYPYYRLLGNKDASDIHGKVNYINRLNMAFYNFAQTHSNFYINDINYISACYGLDKWCNLCTWYMYKYCCAIEAIPDLAYNIVKIMKSVFGRNKKGFVVDLDDTLWGGIIGDDGVENIILGQETAEGQAYSEFQSYLQEHKQLGIILNIDSKNDLKNALAGLRHPDGILKEDDFIVIKANWEPKNKNYIEIAESLSLLPESLVFIDDNPVERAIVSGEIMGVEAPCLNRVEDYIRTIDKMGYFEITNFSDDDMNRNHMYKENVERESQKFQFGSYTDYLKSLEMKGTIKPFESVYMSRIAQLTNKSNQFNLTTKRYTQNEIEKLSDHKNYITLYGRLMDKFGDNGVVSVVIGRIDGQELHIDLWLMSCRVLKRDMEYAMMDALVKECKHRQIKIIHGYYYPTDKNSMVRDFYELQGFEKDDEDTKGNSKWKFEITDNYQRKNSVIRVED